MNLEPNTLPESPDNCESYEIAISAMLDGELEGPEKSRLGQHLLVCASCRQQVRDFESLNRNLELLSRPPANAVRTKPRRRWFGSPVIPAAIATALAICLLVVVWPGNTALNAGQVTAEQIMQPMQKLHQVTLQRQQNHDTELRAMKMDLQILHQQLEELERTEQEAELSAQVRQLINRVNEQRIAMQEFDF